MGACFLAMPTISTDALVLIDKPADITSFDVVRAVCRIVGTRKAGHTGTLDPFATGLLVVLTGRGTRLIRFVPGEPKVYRATIGFGEERDTDDRTGTVTRQAPLPDMSQVLAALPAFTGTLEQIPPAYSAKKVAGRRAYAMARAGESAALAAVAVRVDGWHVLHQDSASLDVRITCGGGTYIRALARDLGRASGSAAHLVQLRRERCGPFDVGAAASWDAACDGHLQPRSLTEALGGLVHETLAPDDIARVAHGMPVAAHAPGERAALIDSEGALLAVARRHQDRWQPEVVLGHA